LPSWNPRCQKGEPAAHPSEKLRRTKPHQATGDGSQRCRSCGLHFSFTLTPIQRSYTRFTGFQLSIDTCSHSYPAQIKKISIVTRVRLMKRELTLPKTLQMAYSTCRRGSRGLLPCAIQLGPPVNVAVTPVLD